MDMELTVYAQRVVITSAHILQVVRYDHNGHFSAQRVQHLVKIALNFSVCPGGWFIEQQQFRLGYEGAGKEYALPLYVKEGKSQLMIAVGCTGGKHRSITFARKIGEFCQKLGYTPSVQHRDAKRTL